MKMFSVAVMSAAVLTGLAGAGVAYEIASAGDSTTATSVTPTAPDGSADAPKPRKRFAPCKPPAVREGKACVTDVVRTVVLPAAGAQVGVAFSRSPSGGGFSTDDFDDFDDHGPLHDAFDDHGGDRDAFDDDFDDGFDDGDDDDDDRDDWDDDHSGSGSDDDSDDWDVDDDDHDDD